MDKEIISTNEEDKPLIVISDKAIHLYKDNKKLQERIDKAIEYMNNTFDISSVKEMYEIMNKLEEILKGEDKE